MTRLKLLLGTQNDHKIEEFRVLLANLPYDVRSLAEEGFTEDPEETGLTFADNAILKAVAAVRLTGEIVLADDSGLEVDALGGAPGVHSKRFAGPNANDEQRRENILDRLKDVEMKGRTARFRCAIALAFPSHKYADVLANPLMITQLSQTLAHLEQFEDLSIIVVEGTCEGLIALQAAGMNGFGYDPIFFIPSLGQTLGQVAPEVKHGLSHRGQASNKAQILLKVLAELTKGQN